MAFSNISSSNSSGAFLDYGVFRSNVLIQTRNQILYYTDEHSNKIGYQWKGELPHLTTSNDPKTDGGINENAWVGVIIQLGAEKLYSEGVTLDWTAHLPTLEVAYNLKRKSLKIWKSGEISTVNDYWLYNDGTIWNGVGTLGDVPDSSFEQLTLQQNVKEWTTIATLGQTQVEVPFDFSSVFVFINGVLQSEQYGSYDVNERIITFSESLQEGDIVHVVMTNSTFNSLKIFNSDDEENLGLLQSKNNIGYFSRSKKSTLDEELKDTIRNMTESELNAAKKIANSIGFWSWKDDEFKRLYIGSTVKIVLKILEEENLDWKNYSFIVYDEWDDIYKNNILIKSKGCEWKLCDPELDRFLIKGLSERINLLEGNKY